MTRKEKMDLLLTKVPEEQKEAFIAELRKAKTKEARGELFKKYQITLTEEEKASLKDSGNKISDAELDEAAGGCCSGCKCHCECGCY